MLAPGGEAERCYHEVRCRCVKIRAGKWLREKNIFLVLKTLKTSTVQNLGFLGFFNFVVKFYTDQIKFHILIVICDFCCRLIFVQQTL